MTETMEINLKTIGEAVSDIMCEARNEALDNIRTKVNERMELIERLLINGEAIIETVYGDRCRKLFAKRHELYMKKWELNWVMGTLQEMRFM